ncbi:hypothetical protein L7F22_012701 [Adiantum nelumboides]|nr:hypothetical protein [Adiantum nelumboides]
MGKPTTTLVPPPSQTVVPPASPQTPSYARPPGSLINPRSTSSKPSSSKGPRGGDKGKRAIDSKGFHASPTKKTFKPRNLASGYNSCNVYDILQDMPSPKTLEAIEVMVKDYHQKRTIDPPKVNLEVNMQKVEEDTQIVVNPSMIVTTFNVKGIKDPSKLVSFNAWLLRNNVDVGCFQEHEFHERAGKMFFYKGYCMFYGGQPDGYSGVLTCIK